MRHAIREAHRLDVLQFTENSNLLYYFEVLGSYSHNYHLADGYKPNDSMYEQYPCLQPIMDIYEQLKKQEFIEKVKITGWLLPNGEFIPCGMYEHLELARKHEKISKIPRIAKVIKDFDDSTICFKNGENNESWHIYEIATSEARDELWRILLNEGFIRVGEVDHCLHFEGRPNILHSKYQFCKDFADSYAATAVFEPRR